MFIYNLHEKGEMNFYLFVSVVHLPSKQLNQMETNLEKNHWRILQIYMNEVDLPWGEGASKAEIK
jgi:hypothetical protein